MTETFGLSDSTGTSSTFGLCMDCQTWHTLGYGCPNKTTVAVPPPTIQWHWSCNAGHWFEAVDQQGHWTLFCRRCGEIRPYKEPVP